MTTDQKKLIFSSFTIKLQFNYCPLIWIFCTKHSLHRINNIHERCLRLVQQNYIPEYERLLENAKEKKCIDFLLIEFYKYLNGQIFINIIYKY